MPKVPTKKQKKKLMALMVDLDWFFGVTNLDRTLTYMHKNDPESPDCACDVTIDRPYQRMSINIYPTFWENTENRQRDYIVHEYCHYLVQPLQEIARHLSEGRLHTKEDISQSVEQVTSSVANIITDMLSGRRKYAVIQYAKYVDKVKKKK